MIMKIKHLKSWQFLVSYRGHELLVDRPKDAGGTDMGPTPGELFIASLGTCIGVYALAHCRRHNIPFEGMSVELAWERGTNPDRIAKITAQLQMPQPISEADEKALLRVAHHCSVHNTLLQAPQIDINLRK